MKDAPAHAPRSRWLRRSAVGCLSFIGILIAAGLMGRGCLMGIGSRRMAEFEAQSDQDDPGWRWEDVLKARATVPDNENAALQILAAAKLLPQGWPQKPAVVLEKKDPEPRDPLGTRLKKLEPPYRLDKALDAELRAELKVLAPAVLEARKVAALPQGRYEINWTRDLYSTLLPHVEKARDVAELLSLDIALRIQDRDVAGALKSLRALRNVGRSLGDEPLLISQLVRIALVSRTVEALERMLAQSAWADEELAAFSQLLQAEEEQAPVLLYQAARAERAVIARVLELAADGEIDLHELMSRRAGAVEKALSWPVMQPLARYGEAPTLELMTRYLQHLTLPPPERRAALNEFDQELRHMKANVLKQPQMIPALLLLPALTKVVDAFDREQAILRCARVALALERFRLSHGRWPDTLEALPAALLSKVPDDPYRTGPLSYRKLGDGAVVYSVGMDGVDNGGLIDRENPGKQGTDLGFRLWDPAKRGQPQPAEHAPHK